MAVVPFQVVLITLHNLVDLVVVEMDMLQIQQILAQQVIYILQFLLFILLLHLDKEMQVDHLLEQVIIMEQVVVDQVQLDKTTHQMLVGMVDRELNFLQHIEIQILVLDYLDLVALNTT